MINRRTKVHLHLGAEFDHGLGDSDFRCTVRPAPWARSSY